MKYLKTFFMAILCFYPMLGWGEFVGATDKRRYVLDQEKNEFPYNAVVRFEYDGATSTGTFISPSLILTCRHCVGDSKEINFYTTDGKQHTGFVFATAENADFAIVATTDFYNGTVPIVNPRTSYAGNVKRIGYESLKVLSDDEISVIKKSMAEILSKPQLSDSSLSAEDKIMTAMVYLDVDLVLNHACSKPDEKNCVHCAGERECIFADNRNLKIQDSCAITGKSGEKLKTNCAGFSGTSGASLLDAKDNSVRGILVSTDAKFEIGIQSSPTSYAVAPETYYDAIQVSIDKVNAIIDEAKNQ